MTDSAADKERIKNIKGIAFKHFAAKQNAQSIFILEKLLPFAPKDEEIYYMISQNYSDQDMPEDAIRALEDGIKSIGPTKKLIYTLCVLLKNDESERIKLKRNIQQLVQLDQNDVDTLFLQANMLNDENKLEEAIEVFKKIHTLDKNSHVSLRSISMCYRTLGKHTEALEYAQKSLLICKEDPLASVLKAKSLIALKQDEKLAFKILDEVAEFAERSPSAKSDLRKSQILLLSEFKEVKPFN